MGRAEQNGWKEVASAESMLRNALESPESQCLGDEDGQGATDWLSVHETLQDVRLVKRNGGH